MPVTVTEVEQLKQENDLLKQEIALLKRKLYGVSSEKGIPDHPDLFDCSALDKKEEEQEEIGAPKPPKKSRKPKTPAKPRIPDHLEVRDETIILPPEVKANPELWKQIGEEHSDRIAFRPGDFYIKRITRPKFVKITCPVDEPNPPIIAELPQQLLDRGILAPELLAHIAVSKYSDHLPLDRQSKIYEERYGIEISPQTMGNGIELIADWLRPIVDLMSTKQFAGKYIQCDETPLDYLKPRNGHTAKGYMWTVNVPGGYCVYHWHNGRSEKCLTDIVPDHFEGTLQCDAYIVYQTFARKRPEITLIGCMAHARRKFEEALKQGQWPVQMHWVMIQIGNLYSIERRLRYKRAGPAMREAVRRSESAPILNRLKKALDLFKNRPGFRPQSLVGKAINYALNQWGLLMPWIDNGLVEIDNNLVENKIRPTKLGLKNWLFIGSDQAGWRSAVIYSIITSCRNFGIEPYTYLVDVLNRLPSMKMPELPSLLPDQWLKARS